MPKSPSLSAGRVTAGTLMVFAKASGSHLVRPSTDDGGQSEVVAAASLGESGGWGLILLSRR